VLQQYATKGMMVLGALDGMRHSIFCTGAMYHETTAHTYLDSFGLNRTKLQIHDGTSILCTVIL